MSGPGPAPPLKIKLKNWPADAVYAREDAELRLCVASLMIRGNARVRISLSLSGWSLPGPLPLLLLLLFRPRTLELLAASMGG